MYRGTLLDFLNMGSSEIMIILVVVLLLFGGKKLPELARGLGKGIRDFKDASEGVKREIHRNINSVDIVDDLKSSIYDDRPQTETSTASLHEQMYPSTIETDRSDEEKESTDPAGSNRDVEDVNTEKTKI